MQDARVDPQVDRLATVDHHNLERQRAQRRFVVGRALLGLAGARMSTHHRWHFRRRWQELHHRIQQRLNPSVAQRGTTQHRHRLVCQGYTANGRTQSRGIDRLSGQIQLGQRVIDIGNPLDQLLARRANNRQIILGGLKHLGRVVFFARKQHALLVNQIVDALKLVLGADRLLNRDWIGIQGLFDIGQHRLEVGTDAVHLVDEGHARDVELVGLVPDRLGLRLNAIDGGHDHDRTVEHP